ncbi:MAG: 4-alpha-glucanotransferase [Bacteroidales bacterium]|nr:4-alpha-glucanotransferase [Bacteroidales bacterium]
MKLNFKIKYNTNWGENLGVMIADQVVELHTTDGKEWSGSADIELPKGGLPLLYRYGVFCNGHLVRKEQHSMAHVIENVAPNRKSLDLVDTWRDPRRVAGVAVPVFSLRSEGSFGVGDFGDLKALIDWAVATKQTAVQILPINDTTITNTWTDSYPYNSISIYAFHPQYIDVRQLPPLNDLQKAAEYEAKRRELNALTQIDYEAVNTAKRAYLREIFNQEGKKVLASAGFKTFAENNDWLKPYAAYSVLRDQYNDADFSHWPKFQTYNAEEIEKEIFAAGSENLKNAQFYMYIQYVLHTQLLAASAYARQNNVILKGDIPIGISRASVEAWVEPFYFNMNGSAGAPPDPFSANGQNWGFPTYNWDAMQKDGLQWWVKRFRKMQEYFSAYRIDHILGFFRIWEIPTHSVHGLLGQFAPSLPMSPEEIGSYGLGFQKEFMTEPFINDDLLEQRFGMLRHYMTEEPGCWDGLDPVEYVKKTFLDHKEHDMWTMKPQFATQRQVEGFFSGKKKQRNLDMKETLYSIISNVLFVEDHRRKGFYHPRISAQLDYTYTRLQGWEKDAFNRLYVDYFYRRHNQFWYEQAMQKLPKLIDATQMIVCGEDLGMVPDCVPWVMNQLQILSLEIQRMPKNPEDTFGHTQWYPVNSVCTTGTHDTETLRQWWEMDHDLTKKFYYDELHESGICPMVASTDNCAHVVFDHLASPSLLCILPLQDWLAIDADLRLPDANAERINIPANPRHYWRYRMHLTIEQLIEAENFNNRVASMICAAGR